MGKYIISRLNFLRKCSTINMHTIALYGINGDDIMLAQLNSAALLGLSVHLVEIEVDAASGLPSWEIVGLPDTAVKESKEANVDLVTVLDA